IPSVQRTNPTFQPMQVTDHDEVAVGPQRGDEGGGTRAPVRRLFDEVDDDVGVEVDQHDHYSWGRGRSPWSRSLSNSSSSASLRRALISVSISSALRGGKPRSLFSDQMRSRTAQVLSRP